MRATATANPGRATPLAPTPFTAALTPRALLEEIEALRALQRDLWLAFGPLYARARAERGRAGAAAFALAYAGHAAVVRTRLKAARDAAKGVRFAPGA